MKASQLATFLIRAIDARLPVLITGAPGIGKSEIVAQAAETSGADLIVSHPAVADPTDMKGFALSRGRRSQRDVSAVRRARPGAQRPKADRLVPR